MRKKEEKNGGDRLKIAYTTNDGLALKFGGVIREKKEIMRRKGGEEPKDQSMAYSEIMRRTRRKGKRERKSTKKK